MKRRIEREDYCNCNVSFPLVRGSCSCVWTLWAMSIDDKYTLWWPTQRTLHLHRFVICSPSPRPPLTWYMINKACWVNCKCVRGEDIVFIYRSVFVFPVCLCFCQPQALDWMNKIYIKARTNHVEVGKVLKVTHYWRLPMHMASFIIFSSFPSSHVLHVFLIISVCCPVTLNSMPDPHPFFTHKTQCPVSVSAQACLGSFLGLTHLKLWWWWWCMHVFVMRWL